MNDQNQNYEIDFICGTAKKMDRCGWIVMWIAVITVNILIALWAAALAEIIQQKADVSSFIFSLASLWFVLRAALIIVGGYIIKCIFQGFAVIVDSHFRKSLSYGLVRKNESPEVSNSNNPNSVLGPWTR